MAVSMEQMEKDLTCPRELVRPCLLLLVAEDPGHGYDLMGRIRQFGFDWGGPGPLYRELRHLESGGLISSDWSTGGSGPARRIYTLTPDGITTLSRWAERLEDLRGVLDTYTTRFQGVARPAASVPQAPRATAPVAEVAVAATGRRRRPPAIARFRRR